MARTNTNTGGGGGGTPSAPDTSVQYNNAGSFFGDSQFTRDPVTHETFIGLDVAAVGTVSDGVSQYVEWKADNVGTIGNSISLVFDGVDDTNTVLSAWNAANPSNTASVSATSGNFVPSAQTINFDGGGTVGYETSLDFLGQGYQVAGTLFTNGASRTAINGIFDSGDGSRPFIGAFDFLAGENAFMQLVPTTLDVRVDLAGTGDSSEFSLDSSTGVNLRFNPGDSSGESGVEFFYHTIHINNAGTTWVWPTTDGASGEVLTTDGVGNLSFTAIPPASAPLTENQIGFGDASDLLDGSANFTYNSPLYYFNQLIPNNVNNGTAIGSPLTFGAASFTGSGLNDFTLTWSVSNYQSKKYGGNLTVSIISAGTPDEFNWIFTGPYSEIIGQGTNVPIVAGPITLLDNDSNAIASIEFAATTGHTFGDSWSAGTSLGAFGWGRRVADTDGHEFLKVAPESGVYFLGDDRIPSPLTGNGTALYINDAIAELGLFANRYLRVENSPGTYTAVLADMQSQIWANYGIFRVLDPSSNVWFDADANGKEIELGDVQSVNNDTVFRVNDTTQNIDALTDGSFNVKDTSGNTAFICEPSTFRTQIGDVLSAGNDTILDIDDSTQAIKFSYAGDSYTFPVGDGTAGQAPITDGAGQLAWGSVAQMYTATETFSSANILNLNGTPRVMVPAAGAGKLIVPIAAYVRLTYNSAPYATNTSLVLKYAGTTNQIMNNDYVLLSTATNLSSFAAPNSSLEDNTAVNADLELTVLGGNPTAGNSVMDVEVQYIIVNVSI